MKHLRTHRPLREIIISYFNQVTPTPWGPRLPQLETAMREQQMVGNENILLVFFFNDGPTSRRAYIEKTARKKNLPGIGGSQL